MITNTRYFETKTQYLAFREKWRNATVATAAHHMLYNIIRGRDPQFGFTPYQRPSKFNAQGMFNSGAYRAYVTLKGMQKSLDNPKGNRYRYRMAEEFVKEFGDTFTLNDLKTIEIPVVEPIYSNYGPGMKIAYSITAGTITAPKTCAGLMDLYNDLRKTGGPTTASQIVEETKEPAPKLNLIQRIVQRVTKEVA